MVTAREFLGAAYKGNEEFISNALKSKPSLASATSDGEHYEKAGDAQNGRDTHGGRYGDFRSVSRYMKEISCG